MMMNKMKPGTDMGAPAVQASNDQLSAMVNFDRDVYCLLGLPFDAVDMGEALRIVRDAAIHRTRCFISTPNLNFLIACRVDQKFRASVINSDLSIADGMPLVWVARMLGIPITERVPGAGLFEALQRNPLERLSVYFFGGPDGIAQRACGALAADKRGVRCAGFASPGFGSVHDMSSIAAIAAINASKADFLVVSLGAKKGQAWIEHNRAQISVPIISHLGAVVNLVAGTIKRAPPWMQRIGLEWLWRIKEEPTLWKRYFSDGSTFMWLLATHVIPHYWFIHCHAPSQSELDRAALSTRLDPSEMVVRLRGAWTRNNLQVLRTCFSRAAMGGTNLRIDLRDVTYIDSAFLGLVLLMHGHQTEHGRGLSCHPHNEQVQKMFELGCCEFLLEDGPPL